MWLAVCLAGALVNVLPFILSPQPFKGTVFFLELLQLDHENNIPTWFSSALLLMNSVLLAFLAMGPDGNRNYWWTLSAVFATLSIDEIASLHEASGRFLSRLIFGGVGQGFFWVLLAAPLLMLMYLIFRNFIMSQPARTRKLMLISAAIYVGGALGMEVVGWIYTQLDNQIWAIYLSITFIEETAEMLGQIVFSFALLDRLCTLGFRIGFEIQK